MNNESKTGRISFLSHSIYTVMSGGEEYSCALSGKIKHSDERPAVGDYVNFSDEIITEIIPRKSFIKRKSAGRSSDDDIMAANVDRLLIVTPVGKEFSIRRIERFLIIAEAGGVNPLVVISKSDLADPVDMAIAYGELEGAGVEFIETSSVRGDGIDNLINKISGETVCAVGISGAGKSTLLNKVYGDEISATSSVREKDRKGRHTTTGRQMYQLDKDTFFIDTPGLREVGVTDDSQAVDEVFEDIASLAEFCLFADCSHIHEPSCAVLEALAGGSLDRGRYESYIKLRRESESLYIRKEDKQRKKRQEKSLSKLVKNVKRDKKRF